MFSSLLYRHHLASRFPFQHTLYSYLKGTKNVLLQVTTSGYHGNREHTSYHTTWLQVVTMVTENIRHIILLDCTWLHWLNALGFPAIWRAAQYCTSPPPNLTHTDTTRTECAYSHSHFIFTVEEMLYRDHRHRSSTPQPYGTHRYSPCEFIIIVISPFSHRFDHSYGVCSIWSCDLAWGVVVLNVSPEIFPMVYGCHSEGYFMFPLGISSSL